MTREKQLAEFLARKGATKCSPAESFSDQAAPLKLARREREHALMGGDEDDVDDEVIERERGAEARYLEIQGVKR